jgi:serine/threonine-protein kinase
MAAVYEAENVDIGKRVAIKVLAQELTASTVVVERFLREARASAAIRSPYICDVYDSGRLEDGRPFLVLELLEGESLYERMVRIRRFDFDSTLTIVTHICRGLTKAHAASIVHRDLKPENIFLTKDEEGKLLAKVVDFGLAKFYSPIEGSGQGEQKRLTREGAVFGTPAYMSPEQVRGQGAVDHRADLWALGCIAYECLTGVTVWSTEQGVAMTFAQIASAPLPQPNELRRDLPPAFTTWFERALHRDVEQRFQTAKELAEELALAFDQGRPSFSAIQNISQIMAQSRRAEPDPRGQEPTEDASATGPPGGEPPPSPRAPAPAGGSARSTKAGFVAATRDTAQPELAPVVEARRSSGAGRAVLAIGLISLLGGATFAGWQFLNPHLGIQVPPTSLPVEDAAPPPSDAASARDAAAPLNTGLPFKPLMRDGQDAIAQGDLDGAMRLLKQAYDKGGHGVPRTMLEHLGVALKSRTEKARCSMTGLVRPRTYDLGAVGFKRANAGPPSIALGPNGPVMTWTDGHEGADHAYAVALDGALRNLYDPIDITPEGAAVARPELTRVAEKFVLTYFDGRGPDAGVHVRWLDPDGRIGGPMVNVASSTGANTTPTLAPAPDGSFFIAWINEGDNDSEDVFLRRLSPALQPLDKPVRVSDLVPKAVSKPRAKAPSISVEGDAVLLAFRVERDPERAIYYMRLPIADIGRDLEPVVKGTRKDRFLAPTAPASIDKARSDSPSVACGGAMCFLVWHGEANSGSYAAFIDPTKPQPLWRKKFTRTGSHPAVAVSASGEGQIAWYEAGRVMTASIGRDGIGPASRIARVSGDQPTPSVVAGAKPGEWYVAWLDFESGYLEPYAVRVLCR